MKNQPSSTITKFLQQESSGGILLVGAAVLAICAANSPLAALYNRLLEIPVSIRIGALAIDKPLLLWINDGLMAVFFLLVGLELKREFIEGELSNKKQIVLPGLGALGGMICPALIYAVLNYHDPMALKGWAIPTATDIAFALGVLSLLGSRIPASLKIFLTSLAIFDDIGAILIIAFFYTSNISFIALLISGSCLVLLALLNGKNIATTTPYVFVGVVMWVALLKSGVHATLAGILLAMFIPMRSAPNSGVSPLKQLEHDLHATVAFIILPLFAFFNSGIDLTGFGLAKILHPVPLGISLGLFIGKQVGIFVFCWLGIKWGAAELSKGISWPAFYGTTVLCGIGFTMSLFIGSLAFEETGVNLMFDERLGIIIGSLLSGIAGYMILRATSGQVKDHM
jgi:Na+:H+ antiporter, NhaA family